MTTPPRPRKRPFTVDESAVDESLPDYLRELPRRIAKANAAGPGYSQVELAEKSGLSQAALSKLAFSRSLVGLRVDTLVRLSRALNVSVSTLLGDTTPTSTVPPVLERLALALNVPVSALIDDVPLEPVARRQRKKRARQ